MTIDDDTLRELGDVRWPPTYRPPAEITARARTLRRRRDALRAGLALGLATVVAATGLALRPGGAADVQPAGRLVPIDIECPRPGGREVPLAEMPTFLQLPPGVPVTWLETRETAGDCRIAESGVLPYDDGTRVTGRWLVLNPYAVGTYRGTATPPGRHETRTIAGLKVDLWWVDDGPVRQLRAYWTAPDGLAFGVHADGPGADPDALGGLTAVVRRSAEIPRQEPYIYAPAKPPTRYLRAGLDVPGVGAVELQVTASDGVSPPPVGARIVHLGDDVWGFWWESDGAGHLSGGRTGAADIGDLNLTGAGLTLERAMELMASLQQVPLTDPRIPRN